jgi:hypothetical protein
MVKLIIIKLKFLITIKIDNKKELNYKLIRKINYVISKKRGAKVSLRN